MSSRHLPYASTPGRAVTQLISDAVVITWTVLWVWIALAVHSAISAIGDAGRQVGDGAHGVASNLDSAGRNADKVPLVGRALSKSLKAAGDAAHDIADAGNTFGTTAAWLAVLLAVAVAGPPVLGVVMPWLFLRLRFFLRKRRLIVLAATPAGEQLLALRALANRPLRQLSLVSGDPVLAWRVEDPHAIRGLAALELQSAGVGLRALRPSQRL